MSNNSPRGQHPLDSKKKTNKNLIPIKLNLKKNITHNLEDSSREIESITQALVSPLSSGGGDLFGKNIEVTTLTVAEVCKEKLKLPSLVSKRIRNSTSRTSSK